MQSTWCTPCYTRHPSSLAQWGSSRESPWLVLLRAPNSPQATITTYWPWEPLNSGQTLTRGGNLKHDRSHVSDDIRYSTLSIYKRHNLLPLPKWAPLPLSKFSIFAKSLNAAIISAGTLIISSFASKWSPNCSSHSSLSSHEDDLENSSTTTSISLHFSHSYTFPKCF